MGGGLTDWLVQVMHQLHYLGIFLLLVLARVIPPVPAESVIPLAGIGAATGEYNLFLVAVAGGLGSLAGQLVWFLPSRLMGRERLEAFLKKYGPWLTIHPKKVQKSTAWFEKRGGLAVLLSQPVPGVRTLISIPAGACGMSILRYSLCSGVGSILWTLVLAWTGYMLSSWPFAYRLVGYFTVGLVAVLVGLYLYRLAVNFREIRRAAASGRLFTPSPTQPAP